MSRSSEDDRLTNLDPQTTPGFLIGRVAHALRLHVGRMLEDAGVQNSAEEFGVLIVLMKMPGPQRMKALAEASGRDATTVSRQVAGLERSRLVKRSPCPDDGRATVVSVTAAGKELVNRTLKQTLELRERALHGLSKPERRALSRALQRMLKNLRDEE